VRELQTGLWHWEAPYPGWTPAEGGPDGWGPLPVELVLPTHGAHTDRAALERALSNHDPQEVP
jgi:hypothetical protein